MKELSIVLKEESVKKIKQYIGTLKVLIDDIDSELIIINNNIDEKDIDLKFEYRLYKYSEIYNNFKDFCMDICLSDNILLIESGVILDNNFVNQIIKSLDIKSNVVAKVKTYISKDKSIYFVDNKNILLNVNSKDNYELDYMIEDVSFIEYDNNYFEDYIYKLIVNEKYSELYKWYRNIILGTEKGLMARFYKTLEEIKSNLDKQSIKFIEDTFISFEPDSKYSKYLNLKKLYEKMNGSFESKFIDFLHDNLLDKDDIYFSYLISKLFKDSKFSIAIYKALSKEFRQVVLENLFKNDEEFYAYLFSFIISLNSEEEILHKDCNSNLDLYREISFYYLKYMSNDSADAERKNILIQVFIEYVNYSMTILDIKDINVYEKFDKDEIIFLMELDKAVTLINNGNIKQAIEKLKIVAEIYDTTSMAVRYYIQKLIIENNLYTSKLSICMIVKNEAKNLPRCLESLKPIIDVGMAELIIVDTGSEDKTVNIAKRHVDTVYFHPWQGSFSEARNHSISLATGEYIMIMDADLEIEKQELEKFINYFNNNEYKKYNTISSEFKNFDNEELTKYSKMTQYHIFKNDGTFFYSGKVHNQPQFKKPCKNLDIIMLHYGYIMTEDIKDKKFYRTAELIKKELEKNPRNLYYRMQLITSYSMHDDNTKALQEVEVLIKQIKDGKVNIDTYLMPYNAAAIVYAANNLHDKVIEISDIVLKKQPDFIDLIYLKANAFYKKKKYKEAATYYKDYLQLLFEIQEHDIIKDDKIIFYTLDQRIEALKIILICYYEMKEFEKFVDVVNNNHNIELLKSCLYLIIRVYLESNMLSKLGELYKNIIIQSNIDELLEKFNLYLVEEMVRLNNRENVLNCFSGLNIESKYVDKINSMVESKLNLNSFLQIIDNYDLELVDIITANMLIDKAVPIILNFSFDENHELKEVVTLKNYSKYIINGVLNTKIFTGFNRKTILSIIQKYLEICISLFNSEREALDKDEDKFIEEFLSALNYIDNNEISMAVKKIRDAVIINRKMANAMDLYLELIVPAHKSKFQVNEEKNKVNEELNEYCRKIKEKIEECINNQELDRATQLINEYQQIINNDVEIYSMKAIIEIFNNNLDKAEECLLIGLEIDKYNFDINYNLAYVYEMLHDYNKALKYYRISKSLSVNSEFSEVINGKISEITNEHKENSTQKKKMVFFVKSNLDSFLGDIIDNLKDDYEIKKVIVTHYNQIDEGMEWADICWFEWCDELIIYGSKHRLAKDKIIICRLHSYEAFTEYLLNVEWRYVDTLIVVSKSIREYLLNKIKFDISKIAVIPNGVDLCKYNYNKHTKGFNICYVGYINYKKGPMLLLQVFKEIYDIDNRYKLFIAGQFQDERYTLYFQQMINDMGLSKNVIFEGWQTDVNKWLEDKDYILCTSLLESQNLSVMQAMSKGIKPIVHNFYGADTIYPKNYLWNTIREAVNMIISETYESEDYRDVIEERYSLQKQIHIIKDLIDSSIEKKTKFNSESYWNIRLNSRFDIEGVGYLGLGKIYNKFLYKIRFEMLEKLLKDLFKTSLTDIEVLELGPGIGMFTEYFYSKHIKKYKGIDITSKSVCELSKKFDSYTFIQGDVSEPILFEKSKYDLIFAADVLLHITDENKYVQAIKNISYSLKENGFAILFEPITMIETKSESEHVIIRDINYVSHILKENELELVSTIPSSFFMNYPFDRGILKEKSQIALDIFNYIQNIYSNNLISDSTKEKLGSWICALEKKCLIGNNFGLSQKVLIIKRKEYDTQDVKSIQISNIFRIEEVCSEEVYWSEIVANNEELNKGDITKILKELIFKIK